MELAIWEQHMLQGPYVVDSDEERGSHEGLEKRARPGIAVLDNTRGYRSFFLPPELYQNESNDQDTKKHKQGDNPGIAPGILRASPLQREQYADDCRDEDSRSREVQLRQLILEARFIFDRLGSFEEQQDECARYGTDREIDIKTPSPGDMICESASH